MLFELDALETQRVVRFIKDHKECDMHSGKITYSITPTGIGNVVEIKCNRCGKVEDVTNYDNW